MTPPHLHVTSSRCEPAGCKAALAEATREFSHVWTSQLWARPCADYTSAATTLAKTLHAAITHGPSVTYPKESFQIKRTGDPSGNRNAPQLWASPSAHHTLQQPDARQLPLLEPSGSQLGAMLPPQRLPPDTVTRNCCRLKSKRQTQPSPEAPCTAAGRPSHPERPVTEINLHKSCSPQWEPLWSWRGARLPWQRVPPAPQVEPLGGPPPRWACLPPEPPHSLAHSCLLRTMWGDAVGYGS